LKSRLKRKFAADNPNINNDPNVNVNNDPNANVNDPNINKPLSTEDLNNQKQVLQLLDRIESSSANLKDIYYSLFDNLNALYSEFPSIYQQMEMSVKLPTNQDAMNIVTLSNDLKESITRFKDPQYLASYLNNHADTIESEF